MLDNISEDLHRKVVDDFGSPKSRQNWAQVSREARRLTEKSDATFYEQWLRDDFEQDVPAEAEPSVKEVYRDRIAVSRQERARLIHLAHTGDRSRFTANIDDAEVQERLSRRYGKPPVADAGLAMVHRLAQPQGRHESPPRLREGELAALERAVSNLHALAHNGRADAAFGEALRDAAQQAESMATRCLAPASEAPPAPKRRRPPGH